jgi:hypothetical protein
LVECGFLTNPTEARLAQTTAYRDKLAEEITRGILGKPALVAREPASRHYPPALEVERQPFNSYIGTDFVKVPPERSSSHHAKKSTKHKKSSKSSHIAAQKKQTETGDGQSSSTKKDPTKSKSED